MKKLKVFSLLSIFYFSLIQNVQAHCPLCTIGAAAAAGGAMWLGVDKIVIGLFIGAFAVSIGFVISKLIKKQYVPFQKSILILLSFVTTILPLLPLLKSIYPVYISLIGDYGSLLNRTYILNLFLIGSILGGLIVFITPWLSSKLTSIRLGRTMPYQGTTITLLLLLVIGAILQIAI